MSTQAMPIDTQQIVRTLTAAGISEAHADAIASVVARTAERHHLLLTETLCSKIDLNEAQARATAEINSVEARLATKIDAVEVRLTAKIESLESKMVTKAELSDAISKSQNKMILWVVGGFVLAQLLPDFLQRLGIT
jgi:hypothetical protein